jgi:hypothetical protein
VTSCRTWFGSAPIQLLQAALQDSRRTLIKGIAIGAVVTGSSLLSAMTGMVTKARSDAMRR